ncbi:hypothetical protein MNBD_GAMMA11-2513 [hydrothermal vent metagenome]|uniref:Uncharacterized protein n=1 Tax=hydrothermal vent metagenome TaxID=652676 RepID=A0A3B0WT20_9ZZZZ
MNENNLQVTEMGIEDKKAMTAATKAMEVALVGYRNICGNVDLNCDIDWSNWSHYDYEKLNVFDDDERPRTAILEGLGNVLTDVFSAMGELFKESRFKRALANIAVISVTGKKDQSSRSVGFEFDGATLNVSINADTIVSNVDFFLENALREQILATDFPSAIKDFDMSFSATIKYRLAEVEKSPNKMIEVYTASGVFSGELVSSSSDVLVLKTEARSMHLEAGMSYINIDTITAIHV